MYVHCRFSMVHILYDLIYFKSYNQTPYSVLPNTFFILLLSLDDFVCLQMDIAMSSYLFGMLIGSSPLTPSTLPADYTSTRRFGLVSWLVNRDIE